MCLRIMYRPLKPPSGVDGEFRLLTLLPGPKNSGIRCKLRRASFSSHSPYEALSYTWGEPKGWSRFPVRGDSAATFPIQINGSCLEIKYNLETALQRLRDERRPRKLWCDAICIDQANSTERNEQVKSMPKIYRQASKVLIWLGEDDEYVDLAFDTVEELCWIAKVHILPVLR
jgi:hypothetical protein